MPFDTTLYLGIQPKKVENIFKNVNNCKKKLEAASHQLKNG